MKITVTDPKIVRPSLKDYFSGKVKPGTVLVCKGRAPLVPFMFVISSVHSFSEYSLKASYFDFHTGQQHSVGSFGYEDYRIVSEINVTTEDPS